jgi:protein-disulfide isomerase
MQKYKKILLSLAIVAVPVISWAVIGNNKDTKVNSNNPNNAGNTSNSTISKQTQENITKVMTENLGAKGTVNVNPSPVNGIVEVEVGGQIVYATPDGRYILVGSILDTKNKINLTQEKMDKKQAVRWSDLPR